MQAQGYRIAENHRLVSMPPERVSAAWKSGGADYGIDIQGGCHEALEHYLGELEIDPILLQLCEEDIEEIARVIPTDDASLIEQIVPAHCRYRSACRGGEAGTRAVAS